jgi:hypothetical protein
LFLIEVSAVELFPGWKAMNAIRAMDAEEHREHDFQGRYPTHHSDWNLLGRYTQYLPTITMLAKP